MCRRLYAIAAIVDNRSRNINRNEKESLKQKL